MNTNLKLNTSLSFKAIEAKARKASAFAAAHPAPIAERTASREAASSRQAQAVGRTAVIERTHRPFTQKLPAIEREIRSIYHALCAASPKTATIRIEYPKQASCKAMIRVYDGDGADTLPKSPLETYALYTAAYDQTRIGSVAIYGAAAGTRRALIRKRGTLFGHRVVSATVEQGRRPFVDVKFAV